MNIELSDFLESFPSIYNENIQEQITSKYEFLELSSTMNESKPSKRGEYYKHQKLYHRYLRNVNRFLILDETGTGKSCSVLGFMEEVRKARDSPNKDFRLSYLTKNIIIGAQKNEIKNQLICKCSDKELEDKINQQTKELINEKDAKSREITQKGLVTKYIKKIGYVIKTYETFTNKINRKYGLENKLNDIHYNHDEFKKLKDKYSNCVFWIDEVHNLISSTETEKTKTKKIIYNTFWNLFHLIENSKVIFTSATPMINKTTEINKIMNLLLPGNNKVPIDMKVKNLDDRSIQLFFPNLPINQVRKMKRKELDPYFQGQIPKDIQMEEQDIYRIEPYFRGRIGYIRSSIANVKIKEVGEPLESNPNIIVSKTYMSKFQNNAYQRSKLKDIELRTQEKSASNFIFPDGNWGISDEEKQYRKQSKKNEGQNLYDVEYKFEEQAFDKYIYKRNNRYFATSELQKNINTIDKIHKHSSNYAKIISKIINKPGNNYVYFHEEVKGSGAIVFSLCLEALGFEKYNESSSIFISGDQTKMKPYCAEDKLENTKAKKIKSNFLTRTQGGPWRYALYVGDKKITSESQYISMMEAYNSYENRHGDIIKAIIVSRVGGVGINLKSTLRTYIISPPWNFSVLYQAISRTIRADAFDYLIQDKKDKGENDIEIIGKIYKYVAVDKNNDSVSIDIYNIAYNKSKKIKYVMRMLKQIAVTCQLHRNRNIRETDLNNYSSECDFLPCKYDCFDQSPTTIDTSTFDLLYSKDIVERLERIIKNIFLQINIIDFYFIKKISEILNIDKKYFFLTIEQLINKRKILINRYGFICYLKEERGLFFLIREANEKGYLLDYYNSNLTIINKLSLLDAEKKLYEQFNNEKVQEILSLIYEDESNLKLIDNLEIIQKINLLEMVFIIFLEKYGNVNIFTTKIDAIELKIINKFKNMIFYINEPTKELEELYSSLNEIRKIKRGRKIKEDVKRKIKKVKSSEIQTILKNRKEEKIVNGVYLHILYSQIDTESKYSLISKFLKAETNIRILYTYQLENGWSNVNELEYPIYNKILQVENYKKLQDLESNDIYGINFNNEFRIRDKFEEDVTSNVDSRKVKKSKICLNWDKKKLIDLMWRLQIPIQENEDRKSYEEEITSTRFQKIKFLTNKKINKTINDLNEWDIEQIDYYYYWYNYKNITVNLLCEIIEQYLRDNNLLLE